jgi:hypothetical protein
MAQQLTDADARQALQDIASSYERLAKIAEGRAIQQG